jgi:hypothetical protein
MAKIICIECGAEIENTAAAIEGHCMSHWGVDSRHIEDIPNMEAQRRYAEMMKKAKGSA